MIDVGQWRASIGCWNPAVDRKFFLIKISPSSHTDCIVGCSSPEWAGLMRALLNLLCGDVEVNPGPSKLNEIILKILEKYSDKIKQNITKPRELASKLYGSGLINDRTQENVIQTATLPPFDDCFRALSNDDDLDKCFKAFCEHLRECLPHTQLVDDILRDYDTAQKNIAKKPTDISARKPADILQEQLPNIVAAVTNDENLADHIKAAKLIASSTVDDILDEHKGRANRVRRFISTIERNLTINLPGIDPNKTLEALCEVLKKQNEQSLNKIAEKMQDELLFGTGVTSLVSSSESPQANIDESNQPKQVKDFINICKRNSLTSMVSHTPHIGKDFFRKILLIETTEERMKLKLDKQMSWTETEGSSTEGVYGLGGVNIEQIFESAAKADEPFRSLIIGSAGSGKTTLCAKICRMWANKEHPALERYSLVLHCQLRAHEIQKSESIDQLISYFYEEEEMAVCVSKWLEKETHGKGVLLLLDGWDEGNDNNKLINNIINGRSLGFCDFIVTSRKYASNNFCASKIVTREFTVLGFTDMEIDGYIHQSLNDDSMSQKVINELNYRPNVRELCRLPLMLYFLITVFHEHNEIMPSTLTELYECFVFFIIKRELNIKPASSITNLKDVFDKDEEFKQICELAFTSICAEERKMSFFHHEVEKCIPNAFAKRLYGLMTSYQLGKVIYEFLHITIQDFLAAYWIHAQQVSVSEIFRKHFSNPHLSMFFRFLAGLTGLKNDDCFNYLIEKPNIVGGGSCIRKPLFGFTRFIHEYFSKGRHQRHKTIYYRFDPDGIDRSHLDDISSCPGAIDFTLLRILYEANNAELYKALHSSLLHSVCTRRFNPSRPNMFDILCLKQLICQSYDWRHIDLRGLGGKQLSVVLEGLSELKRHDKCVLRILELDLFSRRDPVDVESVTKFFLSKCPIVRSLRECYVSVRSQVHHDLQHHIGLLVSLLQLKDLKVLNFGSVIKTTEDGGDSVAYTQFMSQELQETLRSSTLKEFDLFLHVEESNSNVFQEVMVAKVKSVLDGIGRNNNIESFSFDVRYRGQHLSQTTVLDESLCQFLGANTTINSLMMKIDVPDKALHNLKELPEVEMPLRALEIEKHPQSLKKNLRQKVHNLEYLKQSGLAREPDIPSIFASHMNLQALDIVISDLNTACLLFKTLTTNVSLKALRVNAGELQFFSTQICMELENMLSSNSTLQILDIHQPTNTLYVNIQYLKSLSQGLNRNSAIKGLRTIVPVVEERGIFENFLSTIRNLTEVHFDFRNSTSKNKERKEMEILFKSIFPILVSSFENHDSIKSLRLSWMKKLDGVEKAVLQQEESSLKNFWRMVLSHGTLQYISIKRTDEVMKAYKDVLSDDKRKYHCDETAKGRSTQYKKIDWFYSRKT